MEFEKFQNDVSQWILDWVSIYNENLKSVPCPFARNALLTHKIDWSLHYNLQSIENLLTNIPLKGLVNEVLIIGIDKNNVSAKLLERSIKTINENILIPNNLVALEDHPDNKEIINNETMNQGTWALVLVQSLEKLNQASTILQKQGYYNNWSKEAYDDVVSWRFNQST